MLLPRIITAAILVPFVILAVFLLPLTYFSLLVAAIMLLASYEWCKLIGMTSPLQLGLFLLSLLIPMLGLHFWTQILELAAQILRLS